MSVAGPTRAATDRTVPRMLLSRQEAAASLGMSLRHFQRHVQPYVRCVYCGQLRLYRPRDLERWADDEACRRPAA
jgi:DNA-directed RNA polymerase subunit RPC12/RpoP